MPRIDYAFPTARRPTPLEWAFRLMANFGRSGQHVRMCTDRGLTWAVLGIADVLSLVPKPSDKAASNSADITGSAKSLRQLHKQFKTQLHAVARAVYQCLTKLGQKQILADTTSGF